MSARNRPAPPARPGARGSASAPSGGGFVSWLPLLGGLAIGAGILAYIINMFFGQTKSTCPRIDPKKRRWPIEKKSFGPLINRVFK